MSEDTPFHDLNRLWASVLEQAQEGIQKNVFRAWIEPLYPLRIQTVEGQLSLDLEAPNEFSANWVRDHYTVFLESAVQKASHQPARVRIMPRRPDNGQESSCNAWPIDRRYQLESFAVSKANELAFSSAKAIIKNRGLRYNPLTIVGPPGTGKTHLLHAIANRILANNPSCKILLISAETFVNELIATLQDRKMPEFREKYRGCEFLLFDDGSLLDGKCTTQEELIHTMDHLSAHGHQVVIATATHPKALDLSEPLRSRLLGGLVVELRHPAKTDRERLIQLLAKRQEIHLTRTMIRRLALRPSKSAREIEGLLLRLEAQASLSGRPSDLRLLDEVLLEAKHYDSPPKPHRRSQTNRRKRKSRQPVSAR